MPDFDRPGRVPSPQGEWKYISVQRYFIYLERSIQDGTQWAVFENNGPELWARARQSVSDFLMCEWQNGNLQGTTPQQAFFVECGATTMTQNDLDNGRLVIQVGVAPVRPAEFVIFQIGQWTQPARPRCS